MALAYLLQMRIRTSDNREFLLAAELPESPFVVEDIHWCMCGEGHVKTRLDEVTPPTGTYVPGGMQTLYLDRQPANFGTGIYCVDSPAGRIDVTTKTETEKA